jgi:hypothetical protein
LPAGVAFSNREGLSSESQSGMRSFMAVGSRTLPERMWAPISAAFSRSTTRNSSLPASLAICFNRMAALRPAGPRESVSQGFGICNGQLSPTPAYYAHVYLVGFSLHLSGIKEIFLICILKSGSGGETAIRTEGCSIVAVGEMAGMVSCLGQECPVWRSSRLWNSASL